MEEKQFKSFTLVDDNGVETVYDVICTFEGEETGKNYVIYTDNTRDEATNNLMVYASTYDPENLNGPLGAIETEKEWKIIEIILESLQEQVKRMKEKESE